MLVKEASRGRAALESAGAQGTSSEVRVDGAAAIADGERLITVTGDREIAIFRVKGRLVAWENRCPHQGGPVCTGRLIGRTELALADDKTVLREVRSEDVIHLACPWHGWEFDVETGVCFALPTRSLRRVDLVERDGEVYVRP
jgi:nitrite reductase/ring-hydroxylating ferredoxin subunit